jgi:hypothetical protein
MAAQVVRLQLRMKAYVDGVRDRPLDGDPQMSDPVGYRSVLFMCARESIAERL